MGVILVLDTAGCVIIHFLLEIDLGKTSCLQMIIVVHHDVNKGVGYNTKPAAVRGSAPASSLPAAREHTFDPCTRGQLELPHTFMLAMGNDFPHCFPGFDNQGGQFRLSPSGQQGEKAEMGNLGCDRMWSAGNFGQLDSLCDPDFRSPTKH